MLTCFTGGRILAIVVGALLIVAAWSMSARDVGDQASRLHVSLIAASVYEFHGKTGRWPAGTSDLQQTSLAKQCPHDGALIEAGFFVVLWPKDWKPDPKDNGDRLLVYENGDGLRDRFSGKRWVCWGDLRVEYIEWERLQTVLQQQK